MIEAISTKAQGAAWDRRQWYRVPGGERRMDLFGQHGVVQRMASQTLQLEGSNGSGSYRELPCLVGLAVVSA